MSKPHDENGAYGCVFCMTGKEDATARLMEQRCGNVRAMVARQAKMKSLQGKKHTEEVVLFPGYVFFQAPQSPETVLEFPKENVLSVLKSGSGDWQLYGEDARLVQWLFSYGGVISFSKAYREGDQIRIVSGPLKDLEGKIQCIDKRNKSGKVTIQFQNREISVWLGFEIVEQV